ncbi:hypothetical protein OIV83_005026 [Microbotryomycetes sp. JL201]|nr:hypothetical protein OIV83_005026 [Microbotryomycetes sp. JL201]
MGVRDLGQVVKKYAPHAIKPVPSLASLRNKTVAIDANLLTTKFHYAGKPLPELLFPSAFSETQESESLAVKRQRHRHVRGWYWLLKALDKNGIKSVVVFDGATRVPAKTNEVKKRKKKRETEQMRSLAEGDRGERLRELKMVWGSVEQQDRAFLARALKENATVLEAESQPPISPPPEDATLVTDEQAVPPREEPSRMRAERGSAPDASSLPSTVTEIPPPVPLREHEEVPAQFSTDSLTDRAAGQPEQEAYTSSRPSLLESVRERLQQPLAAIQQLYTSFQQDRANPVYSRNQILLTQQEQLFYEAIVRESETAYDAEAIPDAETGSDSDLAAAISRSDELGSTYLFRSLGVPRHAFEDTQTLISALGIPWLRPSDDAPYEAEGLCSALYLRGVVDYVVSEDTDVVVYGAPLLRRISVVPQPVLDGGSAESVSASRASLPDDLSDAFDIFASAAKGPPRAHDLMNVLDAGQLREALGLSRDQFVDFALLCGTDFTERIPLVGPLRALQFIKCGNVLASQYGSIEAALESQSRYQPADREEYLESVRAAREIFLTPPPLPFDDIEEKNVRFERQEPDPNLIQLLRGWGIHDKSLQDEFGDAQTDTSDDIWYGVELDDVSEMIFEVELALRSEASEFQEADDEGWNEFEREMGAVLLGRSVM